MSRVLVTGANGFVGRALCVSLAGRNQPFVPVVREATGDAGGAQTPCVVGDIGAHTDWSKGLLGISEVVHLASRVHVMHEASGNAASLYQAVNTEGTLALARQAAAVGVRRFVFVSTIKVNGEGGRAAYSEVDAPCPADPYAVSKWDAEQGLREIAADSAMEVVIVRPPLVYGPGVKANFLNMMRCLSRGVPLPLGAIDNKRSLVALGNLVDFLITCIDHPAAANETLFVSDGEDLSTTELLVRMGRALGRPARLLPVPAGLVVSAASLLGKRDMARRLCGSLQVDISKARRMLGWSPPVSVDEGLRAAAVGFWRVWGKGAGGMERNR